MPLSVSRLRAHTVGHVLVLFSLALGWGCSQANPAFRDDRRLDATGVDDLGRSPDAPDAVPQDRVASEPSPDAPGVETGPLADGAGPVESPVDAPVDSRTDAPGDVSADIPGERPVEAPAGTTLQVNKGVYSVGEAIIVSFASGPGDAADWIGIYDETAAPPSDASRSLLWYYTDNKGWATRTPGRDAGPRTGSVTFSSGSMGSRQWPLPAGGYKAFFLSSPYTQLCPPVFFQIR